MPEAKAIQWTLAMKQLFNYFPNKPWFLCVYKISLLKRLWEKEKLLVMSIFFFSHSVFYLFRELSTISSNLKLSSVDSWKSLKFVIWKRVNFYHSLTFLFWTYTVDVRQAGEGQLEIMVNNGNLPNTVESDVTGVYKLSFVPEEAGKQTVDIIFNTETHPGTFLCFLC